MPEPGPEARNQGAVVLNRRGRKIRKEKGVQKIGNMDTKSCYQSSRSKETKIASEKHRHKREYSRRTKAVSESEGSAEGHWKSKPKKQKSSVEDDLSQPWVCEETDHFTPRIRYFDFLKARMPSHIKTYDGSEDPEDHLKIFQAVTKTERWAMPTWCHMFNSTLTGTAGCGSRTKAKLQKEKLLKRTKDETKTRQIHPSYKTPKEILALDNGKFKPPPSMTTLVEKRNAIKFCEFHGEVGHTTDEWEKDGMEGPMIIEAEMGGHCVHRIYVDGGFSSKILYEHCFSKFRPEIKNQLIPTNTPLVGFSGEIIWPLGQISLLVKIGRPWVKKIRSILSTVYGMIKFLVAGRIVTLQSSRIILLECSMVSEPGVSCSVINQVTKEKIQVAIHLEYSKQTIAIGSTLTEEGQKELSGLLRRHIDVFAWKPADMTRVPWHIAKHRLNLEIVREFQGIKQSMPQRWLSATKNRLEGRILCGYPYKCFLDAYKGYHQIKMAEEDEENTAFITSQGIFCYSKMPFGLKNVGATYQCLVDKAFQKQIGRNLEVYVDDLVIKSRTKKEVIRDIEETFKTLREINMKLNLKKCAFGMREGTFVGYKVDADGLRVCLDKVEAVLDLPSPKCLKDVQKLNWKLASLNRFLSKSEEKSLPFHKMLKKCTKKSDFQWTAKAEVKFKEIKQLIAEIPMLTESREKEELIMYLAAAKEAINAVLMTERDEKQAHTLVVITDEPIKQLLSNPEVTGRLLKWRFKLREHDIQYRPRTSVKEQILADFIVEHPKYDTPDTLMEDKEELPDPRILFTDGSACINGSEAGLIITNPEGMEFTYVLRFKFNATNNEAGYKALIAGLRIAGQMKVQNLQANVDSKLVANQVNEIYIAKESSMIKYLEKVKNLASTFKGFFIKQIPRGENKIADALSKIASTSFAHLSKQVLVEELREKNNRQKRDTSGSRRRRHTWMTPVYEYVTEGILFEEKRKQGLCAAKQEDMR
nr:hypothetical protein [Tanacetum cinerariifolium]